MRFQASASLAAGASVANVLAGQQIEIPTRPSRVRYGITGSAVGLLATVTSGSDVVLEESAVPGTNAFPKTNDDFFSDAALPHDRQKVSIRNPTGGALTYFVVVEVLPA